MKTLMYSMAVAASLAGPALTRLTTSTPQAAAPATATDPASALASFLGAVPGTAAAPAVQSPVIPSPVARAPRAQSPVRQRAVRIAPPATPQVPQAARLIRAAELQEGRKLEGEQRAELERALAELEGIDSRISTEDQEAIEEALSELEGLENLDLDIEVEVDEQNGEVEIEFEIEELLEDDADVFWFSDESPFSEIEEFIVEADGEEHFFEFDGGEGRVIFLGDDEDSHVIQGEDGSYQVIMRQGPGSRDEIEVILEELEEEAEELQGRRRRVIERREHQARRDGEREELREQMEQLGIRLRHLHGEQDGEHEIRVHREEIHHHEGGHEGDHHHDDEEHVKIHVEAARRGMERAWEEAERARAEVRRGQAEAERARAEMRRGQAEMERFREEAQRLRREIERQVEVEVHGGHRGVDHGDGPQGEARMRIVIEDENGERSVRDIDVPFPHDRHGEHEIHIGVPFPHDLHEEHEGPRRQRFMQFDRRGDLGDMREGFWFEAGPEPGRRRDARSPRSAPSPEDEMEFLLDDLHDLMSEMHEEMQAMREEISALRREVNGEEKSRKRKR